ncbi:hypothetical protein I4U23_021250 [Adineta vaga]|nr:hypothetical protein I4U23_021250 [Adineta vaga]
MSGINHHEQELIPYLFQQGISLSMISILEKQRINYIDLQTMDRDDVEHLFKNEYGFTFAARKQFWNTIRTFRPSNKKSDVIYLNEEEKDEMPDIYEVIKVQPLNYAIISPFSSSSIPRISSTMSIDDADVSNTINVDNLQTTATSSRIDKSHQLKTSSNVTFRYPVELPLFSPKITEALENNTILNEWRAFIKELVNWILSRRSDLPNKSEYQAIGHSLFKVYPGIGRDGFRPWSHLCKCLTESLRKERYKRGLSRVRKVN